MPVKYCNLLSPIKIGNTVLKNRLIASTSKPYFIQGDEPYPTDAFITHYANKAKNGAAIVTVTGSTPQDFFLRDEDRLKIRIANPSDFNRDRSWLRWGSHGGVYDLWNAGCQHYFSELTEVIHFYKSKASMPIPVGPPDGFDVSSDIPFVQVYGGAGVTAPKTGRETPAEMLEEIADQAAFDALYLKEVGFDMVHLHMSYRAGFLGRFLSPLTNQRTDKFGGSLVNRARFPIMVADCIKQKCGKDFLVEANISGYEPVGGFTIQDAIEYARLFTGHIDLLQIRGSDIDHNHPTHFYPERTPFLHMAEAIKKSGVSIPIAAVGGFQNLDVCEEVIASGKADLISMARAWICDPEYGRKAYEERGEDVVPCLLCNQCHMSGYYNPYVTVCAVNPTWGLENRIKRMIEPPKAVKQVAVVGGGPGGIQAALKAAERGHQVTLYEKSGSLGGMLKKMAAVSFKWPHKEYQEYLIRQVKKSGIKVKVNTEATPEMLKKGDYDAVLVAIGAEPLVPPIPGTEKKNVLFAENVYGREDTLAENLVIIGGGEVGVETGMHLAEKGHQVTVLEMGGMLAAKAPPAHYYTMFKEAWEKIENFKYVLHARCTGIGADSVTYTLDDGTEHTITAGNVIIATGTKARHDQALRFYGTAREFFMIGDCDIAGNIQKTVRSAYSVASML